MLGNLGRRAVETVVLLFALLGFVFVPLGKKTGFEHARAIWASRAVSEAVRETLAASARAKEQLLRWLTEPRREPRVRERPAANPRAEKAQ